MDSAMASVFPVLLTYAINTFFIAFSPIFFDVTTPSRDKSTLERALILNLLNLFYSPRKGLDVFINSRLYAKTLSPMDVRQNISDIGYLAYTQCSD